RKSSETNRDRVLTKEELHAIWNALPDDQYGDIVRLLALTGQRRDEIACLRWSEIAGTAIVLPLERTKTGGSIWCRWHRWPKTSSAGSCDVQIPTARRATLSLALGMVGSPVGRPAKSDSTKRLQTRKGGRLRAGGCTTSGGQWPPAWLVSASSRISLKRCLIM